MANILYLAQFFTTEAEPGGQGQRHFCHAKALAESGHQVTVITSGGSTMQIRMPHDAQESQDSKPAIPNSVPMLHHPNLNIIRVAIAPFNQRCVIHRALRYFSFSAKALCAGLKLKLQGKRDFDFVLGSSPPLLVAFVAYVLSVLNHADFYMEVRDLWSQTMRANGFINNQLAIRLNQWMESWLYRQSAKIITVSPAFAAEIEMQTPGVLHKIQYLPNGADLEFYQAPRLWSGSYLRTTPEDDALFHVNYAGVFSDYTKLETLLDVAEQLQERSPNIRINLAGGGYQLDTLQQQIESRQLQNVKLWPALPKNRISKFIMEGDLSIINYRNLEIFGQVLPNKLFDYLAAGKPILAAVPQGEVSRILAESGAGISIEAEQVELLVEKILWFQRFRSQGEQMGRRGQDYVRKHFNRRDLTMEFLKLFPRLLQLHPTAIPVDALEDVEEVCQAAV